MSQTWRLNQPGLIGDRIFWLAACFLCTAIVLGGGGTPNPLPELLLQGVTAVFALILLVHFWRSTLPANPPLDNAYSTFTWSCGLVTIALALVALPALQLVPLPPQWWQTLPGRETLHASLALVGAADSWRPVSLLPARTLASLLALGPPLLLIFMVSQLDHRGRQRLLGVVVLLALATALLGALQIISGSPALRPYAHTHDGWLTGFQANRNATADLLLIGMVALAAWLREQPPSGQGRWLAASGLALLLMLAVLLTGSRMGIMLMPLAVIACLVILAPRLTGLNGKRVAAGLAGLGFAAMAMWLLLRDNAVLGRITSRFAFHHDFRPELWADTWFAISQYWPFGVGMGGFTPALMAAERLEVVDESWPNRAHNDYLELALEAGAAGIAVLTLVLVVLLAMIRSAWRRGDALRGQVLFALAVLGILAAHSLVDYPLRSLAIASLAAMAVAMLTPLPRSPSCATANDATPQNEGLHP